MRRSLFGPCCRFSDPSCRFCRFDRNRKERITGSVVEENGDEEEEGEEEEEEGEDDVNEDAMPIIFGSEN